MIFVKASRRAKAHTRGSGVRKKSPDTILSQMKRIRDKAFSRVMAGWQAPGNFNTTRRRNQMKKLYARAGNRVSDFLLKNRSK